MSALVLSHPFVRALSLVAADLGDTAAAAAAEAAIDGNNSDLTALIEREGAAQLGYGESVAFFRHSRATAAPNAHDAHDQLDAFVRAASVYGGHVPAVLREELVSIWQMTGVSTPYTSDEHITSAMYRNIRAAVLAANTEAERAEWGDDNPDAQMVYARIERLSPASVRITYGGGRTYAALDIEFGTGKLTMSVGAYPDAVRFESGVDIVVKMADIAVSIDRRARAARGEEVAVPSFRERYASAQAGATRW